MSWLYKGKPLEDCDIPEKAEGFIYVITHVPSGVRYIGRKLLTKAHTRQKNKKIIRSRIESDWRDYWSSSPIIKEMIEAEGTIVFVREVLVFAETKGQLNYLEEKFLYGVGAIESDQFFNSNIRSKMFKRNILNKFDVGAINKILDSLKQEGAQ